MAEQSQESNKLEFNEAMRDFRKMFPSIEDEIIESVLRANNGAVDDTIDQLLVMSLDREENAYAETVPKRIGDLETASPRVDIQQNQMPINRHSNPTASNRPTNPPPLSSYWLIDMESDHKSKDILPNGAYLPSSYELAASSTASYRRKKMYHPPLIGELPKDFLRISISSDPWEESPSTPSRSVSRSYTSRRSTDHDYRRFDDETLRHEGPPPSYSSAIGRRYSETESSRNDKLPYQSPRHTYLGVFRTTSKSHTDNLPQSERQMREAIAENEWKRRVVQDPELAQYLEDERIAIMLQNEEFMHQLRNDHGFLAALERDAAETKAKLPQKSTQGRLVKSDYVSSPIDPTQDGASYNYGQEDITPADPFPYTKVLEKSEDSVEYSFQEKLAVMGRTSKRKFATLARRFIHKSRASKGILDNNESRTHVSLLGSDEESDDEQPRSGNVGQGYNQANDDDYNIGHQRDLKQGRFF